MPAQLHDSQGKRERLVANNILLHRAFSIFNFPFSIVRRCPSTRVALRSSAAKGQPIVAQGNALGMAHETAGSPERAAQPWAHLIRHNPPLGRPFMAWRVGSPEPRALSWAAMDRAFGATGMGRTVGAGEIVFMAGFPPDWW
jgi:hypothetical protein